MALSLSELSLYNCPTLLYVSVLYIVCAWGDIYDKFPVVKRVQSGFGLSWINSFKSSFFSSALEIDLGNFLDLHSTQIYLQTNLNWCSYKTIYLDQFFEFKCVKQKCLESKCFE